VNCTDFEAKIDRYLDGALDSDASRAALDHTSGCTTCDTLVTRYQQTSALLQTAVTDRVAAVDVSGLWEAIASQVPPSVVTERPPSIAAASPTWGSVLARLRDWVATLTPARVGAMVATAAAVALLFASVGEDTSPERVARNGVRTKSKAVRIETMEIPSGYTVSTWSRPRSRTHVIAISPSPAYTLASASR